MSLKESYLVYSLDEGHLKAIEVSYYSKSRVVLIEERWCDTEQEALDYIEEQNNYDHYFIMKVYSKN
jgi:hypothetical protein